MLQKLSFPAIVLSAALLGACAPMSAHHSKMMAPAMMSGGVLVGANGMTLYTFDRDTVPGKSACNGPCAVNWPPLMVKGDAMAHGDWSIVTRDDGSKQWAYKNKPVYFWIKDQKPGDRTGDGVNQVWHVIQ